MDHENSFWKSNMRAVPGRPSPKRELKAGKGGASTSSFENYQKSVSDAWNLSEDELTKEYCILSTDSGSKAPPRRPKGHLYNENQLPFVHKALSAVSSPIPTTSNNLKTATKSRSLQSNKHDRLFIIDANKVENSSKSIDQQAGCEKSVSQNIEYG